MDLDDQLVDCVDDDRPYLLVPACSVSIYMGSSRPRVYCCPSHPFLRYAWMYVRYLFDCLYEMSILILIKSRLVCCRGLLFYSSSVDLHLES